MIDRLMGVMLDLAQHQLDTLVWRASSVGAFSIRTARSLVEGQNGVAENGLWRKIWKTKGPSRIAFTLWTSLHRALPTTAFFWKRRITSFPCCDYCGKDEESDLHVLRDCKDTVRMWKEMLPADLWGSFFQHNKIHGWFVQNLCVGADDGIWPRHWAYIFR